jgi:hypothetical protein
MGLRPTEGDENDPLDAVILSSLTRDASYICNEQIKGWDSQRNQLTC